MTKYAIALITLLLYSCTISQKKSQKLFNVSKEKTYDVVVVPGIPHNGEKWERVLRWRVYWGKYLYDLGIAKNIMFSGGAVYTPYYEAEIMALYAKELGMPEDAILTETKAEHSTENIYYGYKKAKQLGFESIALASDPFQTKMLKKFIKKKVDPSVDLIPFVFDSLSKLEPLMIDPEIEDTLAYKENFVSITERESFRKRFRGTQGKNLNDTYYSE
ncbi:YdcF family protein [Arcticibacterium luteifluviistationis]|uniref:YdcF family protein n=1 Tax=Arcticibacterium luteifluviistationis TaxID=1784714 RepID=A0A2Z4G9D9_9BACT|nr:YdcF family protein [Arcticibacterium luteifluviistationis]AWV97842.1 YdcF family protein [Arcticibacterium luteifluviistationis]